jgi:hypothetical protein
MKKNIVFILIFFLLFFIQFGLVSGLSVRCRHYVDGVCQTEEGYSYSYSEEVVTPEVEEVAKPYTEPPKFVVLIFQLIGIVVLVSLLIIMVQEFIKSRSKKPKKGR